MDDGLIAQTVHKGLATHLAVATAMAERAQEIVEAGRIMADRVAAGGKIMFCGNGGSAADAQHLAAELVGRFEHERAPIGAIALHANSSALTAIGNDYGYEDTFLRPLQALGRSGDVLVAISTSGNSANVIKAADAARAMGIVVIGLTGQTGGELAGHCDLLLAAPSRNTARIQEAHILMGHLLCEIVELAVLGQPGKVRAQA